MTGSGSKLKNKSHLSQGVKSLNPLSPLGSGTEIHSRPEETEEDEYDEEDDDGTTPGPGAYFNPQTSTTFKMR